MNALPTIVLRAILPLLGLWWGLGGAAQAATTVLVWPIYQTIDASQAGSALWLENRGSQTVNLQVRVLAWSQRDRKEVYADQDIVVASPPFASVAPGQRQLVRLVRTRPVEAGVEHPFRILIDEILEPLPAAPEPVSAAAPGGGVGSGGGLRFQKRYVLPLFLYGEGLAGRQRGQTGRRAPQADASAQPVLDWHLEEQKGRTILVVRNQGRMHARLSAVHWTDGVQPERDVVLSDGFLGYVLPGQEMSWPLPEKAARPGPAQQLFVQLKDNTPSVPVPARP